MSITVANIGKLTPEQLYIEFLEAIKELIEMDASDYADGFNDHAEWVARECWERMAEKDKNQVKEYIPNIEACMMWGDMGDVFQTAFYELYTMFYGA